MKVIWVTWMASICYLPARVTTKSIFFVFNIIQYNAIIKFGGKCPLLQEIICSAPEAQRSNARCKGAFAIMLMEKKLEEKEVSCKESAEYDIRKTYHKQLFTPFAKAINRYELLSPGDKVAVCISGGKDSFLMAKLFQELKRHRKFDFDLDFISMDPGYLEVNRQLIRDNAELLDIPLTLFESDIFDIVDTVTKNPCYLCARMRRGHLYAKAKELGCNKIALGHHFDDVIETILMGMLYGAQMQTMMPKIRSTNFEGMELIRPMYLIREEDIIKWAAHNDLRFLQCACHFTETCETVDEDGNAASARLTVKNLIREMKKTNPFVETNIFNSAHNVNLSTLLAYKQDGVVHEFLEWYG